MICFLSLGVYIEVPFHPRGFLHHDIDFSPVYNTFLTLHRAVDRDKQSPSFNVLFDDIYEVYNFINYNLGVEWSVHVSLFTQL